MSHNIEVTDKTWFENCDVQLNCGYVTLRRIGGELVIDHARQPTDMESYVQHELTRHNDIINTVSRSGIKATSGVVTVLGIADTAKSPLGDFLAAGNTIHFGEPLPGVTTRAADAAVELYDALFNAEDKVVCFDSVKNLLSRGTSGGAAARGVSRSIFPMLSDWSSVSASLGKTIVVPINISTNDPDALVEIEEAMRSNATMHILAKGDQTYEYLARTPGKGKRVRGSFTAQFTGSKITKLTVRGGEVDTDTDSWVTEMMDTLKIERQAIKIPKSLLNNADNA